MRSKGFTLIELLAVIVVLAIILAIAIPGISGIIESSKKGALKADAGMIERAAILKLSKDDNYDFSIINKSNVKAELNIDGSNYDAVGIENNAGKITVTVVRGSNAATSSNDPAMNNAKVYGLHWDGEDTFTRTDDATNFATVEVGVGTNTVTNDFDSAQIYSEMVEVTDSYGNQFIKIPKFYIKKTVNGKAWTWQVSKDKKDNDYYLPACFVDETSGKILPYVLVGKYDASLSNDNKLESKTGKAPLVNKTIAQFRDYAKANGDGYQLLDIHVVDILQTLFYIEFAVIDSNSVMSGFTYGEWWDASNTILAVNGNTLTVPTALATSLRVGQMIDIETLEQSRDIAKNLRITAINGDNITYETVIDISEMLGTITANAGQVVRNQPYLTGTTNGVTAKSGSMVSNSDKKYAMKYRGIENLYGNIWQFVDGLNIKDNQAYISRNANTYISDKYDDDYTKVGYVNANASTHIMRVGFDKNNPFVNLPIEISSYEASKYKDYYYQSMGNKTALIGGDWYIGNSAGL